jgi:2-polyprenyl-6-methoxyphenol hydroxylase-like FAD-dependent oxidoreductase
VTLRFGVRALGLMSKPGQPPHVVGVRTDEGELSADLVIDAAGQRSPVDRWLDDIGAQPAATAWAECGIAYYSRHYRIRPGAELPGLPTTRIVAGLDEFTVGIWGADNGAMQLVVAPLATDRRFRTLKHPEVFTAVLRTIPTYAAWLDVLDPITPMFQMAGLHNTMRRLVVGGVPVVTGLHAIGDSVCTTNPSFGRGLSLALLGAADLLDTVDRHGDDWTTRALALDELVADHVVPFYEDQAAVDYARLAMLRRTVLNAPAPEPPPANSDRITIAQLRGQRSSTRPHFAAYRRSWARSALPMMSTRIRMSSRPPRRPSAVTATFPGWINQPVNNWSPPWRNRRKTSSGHDRTPKQWLTWRSGYTASARPNGDGYGRSDCAP